MSRIDEKFRARTKAFAAAGIRVYKKLPHAQREVEVVGHQLLRSATSVAANVREASRARSSEEFVSKLGISLQEADESQLWIELLREECGVVGDQVNAMHAEAEELIAMFVTTIHRTKTGS